MSFSIVACVWPRVSAWALGVQAMTDARVEMIERLLLEGEVPLPELRRLLDELREAPRQTSFLDEPDVIERALANLVARQEAAERVYAGLCRE